MKLDTASSVVCISEQLSIDLQHFLDQQAADQLFLLVDENTRIHCLPLLADLLEPYRVQLIETPSGESNKHIEAVIKIWDFLNTHAASRNSLLLNLGGGLLTDLGGFVASTFKRGMRFANIPTTLLGMVDAAVGGKTGINFNEYKNEVGVINHAEMVLVHPLFLNTIDQENLLSGFAEMIKHALISSPQDWENIQAFPIEQPSQMHELGALIARSIYIKDHIVVQDPYEQGVRKSLNFGHTVAHAFESMALHKQQHLFHGHAVAYGMIVELYLSYLKCGFAWNELKVIAKYIAKHYGRFIIDCDDYPALYESMTHDKKNENKRINFTLLSAIGAIELDQDCSESEIFEALDFYRDAVGL